jgi:hypothetical protein
LRFRPWAPHPTARPLCDGQGGQKKQGQGREYQEMIDAGEWLQQLRAEIRRGMTWMR